MAQDHPFHHLFETLGRVPAAHAESVNRHAFKSLSDALKVPTERTGRCILLRAPRAGHGKTHLLCRVQQSLGPSHEFIPLKAVCGTRFDTTSVMEDTLQHFLQLVPGGGGLCALDLVARRLFASALQPLVISGDVPCQDKESALSALRLRPLEAFDFHHPDAVTAHWARENFDILGERLSHELSRSSRLPIREVAFWVGALFRFASAPLEDTSRVRILTEAAHSGNHQGMDRLVGLLGLLTQLMRIVLVADDVEGFSADESSALNFAAFLGSLRHSAERLDVILSVNQDIWQSSFLPRLSHGLIDRLTEIVIELEPLTHPEIIALLDSRVPGVGNRILGRIDLTTAGSHARGIIRAAGTAWSTATALEFKPLPSTTLIPLPPASPTFIPIPEPEIIPEPAVFIPEPVPFIPEPEIIPEPAPFIPEPEIIPEPAPFIPVPEIIPEPASEPEIELDYEPEPQPLAPPTPAKPAEPTSFTLSENAFSNHTSSPIPFEVKFPIRTPKPPASAPANLPEHSEVQRFVPVNVAEVLQEASAAEPVLVSQPPTPQVEDLETPETETALISLENPLPNKPYSPFTIHEDALPPKIPFTPIKVQPLEDVALPPSPPKTPLNCNTQRVDDLLRQFSERYGKKGL